MDLYIWLEMKLWEFIIFSIKVKLVNFQDILSSKFSLYGVKWAYVKCIKGHLLSVEKTQIFNESLDL